MHGILIFFKLCVFDCGRLLRVDEVTVEKERFDYARVLIATSSLEVINTGAKIMVDGVIFDFKIIEEWRFSLGEDACLLDEYDTQEVDNNSTQEQNEDGTRSGEVNKLLQQLSEEWSKEADLEDVNQQQFFNVDIGDIGAREGELHGTSGSVDASSLPQHAISRSAETNHCNFEKSSPTKVPMDDHLLNMPQVASEHFFKKTKVASEHAAAAGCSSKAREVLSAPKRVVKRTLSCPPVRDRSIHAGPWSLDWVKRKNLVDASANISSNSSTINKSDSSGVQKISKTKGGGYLRHCALSLKRIARLPDKDRKEVLRALQRAVKKRRLASDVSKSKVISNEGSAQSNSQTSVNNDWSNWLVLHGNKKVVDEDVLGIGKTVGLKFNGDKNNMFSVLSGTGRKNQEGDGKVV